jgi:hypothetical protein
MMYTVSLLHGFTLWHDHPFATNNIVVALMEEFATKNSFDVVLLLSYYHIVRDVH